MRGALCRAPLAANRTSPTHQRSGRAFIARALRRPGDASPLGSSGPQQKRKVLDVRQICNLRNDIQQKNISEQRAQEQQRERERAQLDAAEEPAALSARERLLRQRVASDVEEQLVLRQLQDLQAFVASDPELLSGLGLAAGASEGELHDELLRWVLEATDVMALKSPVATLELLEWVARLGRGRGRGRRSRMRQAALPRSAPHAASQPRRPGAARLPARHQPRHLAPCAPAGAAPGCAPCRWAP
jgi:hypothetical protein